MSATQVHINFEAMASAVREYARHEAIKAHGTIIYVENGQLIEENPDKKTKTTLKKAIAKS